MLYHLYLKHYQQDNHSRPDALPEPVKAKRLATELNKRFTPGHTTIDSQLILSRMFNLSIPSLIRFQELIMDSHYHKFMPLSASHTKSTKRSDHHASKT